MPRTDHNYKKKKKGFHNTKKIITSVLIVIALAVCFSSIALGDMQFKTLTVDFSNSYVYSKENGAITLRYNPASWFMGVRTSTDIAVSGDGSGYAGTQVTALNNNTAKAYSENISNGIINSGKAIVSGQSYAKRAVHAGSRTISGTTSGWHYDCY